MAKKTKSSGQDEDLFRIASFMLFDALVFHEVLAAGHAGLRPASQANGDSLQAFLRKTWLSIRNDINYKPVFDLALDILDALPSSPESEEILRELIAAAVEAVRSGILRKHDFMGRIYHKLLLSSTGHYYATYYTSLPAAWMLTGLLIRDPNPAWNFGDEKFYDSFRLIDPACGSGTLLSASYTSIRDQYIKATAGTVNLDLLHEILLSHSIHGWDVLDFAAHLSLTNLALHSDTVTSNRSNIYRMPLGASKGNAVQLGSLEYLRKALELKGIALAEPTEQLHFEGRKETDLSRLKYDVVIMNPPFSRSAKPNLNFGYTEKEARSRMQASLSELGRSLDLFKASVAGLTPFFMELGLDMIKPNGRIGLVAPRSILSGVGTSKTRRNYEASTHIRFIVSNYDPGSREERIDGWSWSENTDLGEILLVAQDIKGPIEKKLATTFVNVFRRPRNEAEALILSQAVLKRLRQSSVDLLLENESIVSVLGVPSAAIYSIPQSLLAGNWLKATTFAQPMLNRLALQTLASSKLVNITKILALVNRELATGRDIAPIKQNFIAHPVSSDGRMILGHQSTMNKIAMPSSYITHAKGLRNPASKKMYSDFGATLLLAERPHMSTESLLSFIAPEKVLTTAFWELQLQSDTPEDWVAFWFNSTYGIASYLACSTSSQGDIFKLKKDQLKNLVVPQYNDQFSKRLDEARKAIAEQTFSPYPAEFALAAKGHGPRIALDSMFRELVDLPSITPQEYFALSVDPVICKMAVGTEFDI